MAGTKVTVINNGSLRIEGDFEIVDQEGKPFGLGGRKRVTLCRGGQSSKPPTRLPATKPRTTPSKSRALRRAPTKRPPRQRCPGLEYGSVVEVRPVAAMCGVRERLIETQGRDALAGVAA